MDKYFQTDDGSLPEVEVRFSSQLEVEKALVLLGARTNAGPDLSSLKVSDHVVLSNLVVKGVSLPPVGVFVSREQLVLDYRMGKDWGKSEIEAFLDLLRELHSIEGVVAAPWWGSESRDEWSAALAVPNPTFQRTATRPLN